MPVRLAQGKEGSVIVFVDRTNGLEKVRVFSLELNVPQSVLVKYPLTLPVAAGIDSVPEEYTNGASAFIELTD
jgi:hypothetical protein